MIVLASLAACARAPTPPISEPTTITAAAPPSPSPRAAPARPAGVARSWETGPEWAYLEVSSVVFHAQLDDIWGGLAKLGAGQLAMLALEEPAQRTLATVRASIDETRPMRVLVSSSNARLRTWALLFGANKDSTTAPLPEGCAQIERVVLCGTGASVDALRDDYFARGLDASASTGLHAEQRTGWVALPARVVIDATEDNGLLHATLLATPRQPVTASISAAAIAAASRLQASSPRVEVGAFSGRGETDLPTAISFEGYSVVIDGYTARIGDAVFVESAIDETARHVVAYWRSFQGNGMTTRVDPVAAPANFPKGTRRFRRREWQTDSGKIQVCSPEPLGQVMGGCRVVGHRPPRTILGNDADFLLVPADGGTWITMGGDPHQVTAIQQLLTAAITIPRLWTVPAAGAGKLAMPHAELLWAQHAVGNGDLATEIEGRRRP